MKDANIKLVTSDSWFYQDLYINGAKVATSDNEEGLTAGETLSCLQGYAIVSFSSIRKPNEWFSVERKTYTEEIWQSKKQ